MYRLACFLLACLLIPIGHAEFTSPQDFNDWLTHYYLHPEPARVAEAIRYATNQHLLDKPETSSAPILGFISGVVTRHPEQAADLLKDLDDLPAPQRDLVVLGVWYANLPNDRSRQLVDDALDRHPDMLKRRPLLAQDPIDVLSLPTEQGPWVLDANWGRFFATGERAPVLRVISALPWMHESRKQEDMAAGRPGLMRMVIAGAAQWSLTANARQHSAVLKICEVEAGKQDEPVASQLKAIVLKARNMTDGAAFPALKPADKPFDGLVLVTDDPDWQSKWATPEDTVPRLNTVSHAKRGKKLAILTMVVRPGMDADRNVKVDCDLRLVKPDGQDALRQEGSSCLKGQLKGAQDAVYLSAPVLSFIGEESDPLGVWRFDVVLHDRIRGVDRAVSAEFTLEP